MSEVTWYGRFAVWVGAVVLLVQAVAGRGAGLMSLIATLLLAVGIAVFLVGLVIDASAAPAPLVSDVGASEADRLGETAESDAPAVPVGLDPSTTLELPEASIALQAADAQEDVEEAQPPPEERDTPVTAAEVDRPEGPGAHPDVLAASATAPDLAPVEPAPRRLGRIPTERLDDRSPLLGDDCVHCGHALVAGDVVAVCPLCFEPQHAQCWIDNHFRCSTPNCAGAGRLLSPDRSA
jgi:hypothetical protein